MFKACLVSWPFFLLLLMLGSLNAHLGFVVGCHDVEREALLKFRHSLNDTKNWLSSWEGNDCCRWEGVGCDNVTSYVSRLVLDDPYYDPRISPWTIIAPKLDHSLVVLSHLNYLELSCIDFQGSQIPGFIGSYKHLRYLNLSYSNFGGVVPSQLGNLSRLQTLDLSRYMFSNAALSSDLKWVNMPSLLGLRLSGCQLNVPNFLSLFSNITLLSTIQHLDLSSNSFHGSFPAFVVNMTSLRYLDLSVNGLNGLIPLWLRTVSKLEHLDLSTNSLEGSLSHVLTNMTSLTYLDLSYNNISSISLWPRNMRKLEFLDLSHNFLEGPLPRAFANMTSLTYLGVSSNKITSISPWLRILSKLEQLDLSENLLEGPLPLILTNMSSLAYLDLSSNKITSIISFWPRYLGKLEYLDLSTNSLEGPLPHAFANMTSLTDIDLSWNNFNGSIRLWIRNMRKLQNLDLSQNKFSQVEGGVLMGILGNLCNLISFDWSKNQIVGEIGAHHNLSNCVTYDLEELYLDDNKIGGTLPSWLGDFKRLRFLDVSNNSIEGPIPVSIARLSYLEYLDLSINNLTGNIPEGLGQCMSLVIIDLWSNNLQGVVSESHFVNLSSLQELYLSYNSLEVKLSSKWSPPFQLSTLSLVSCKMQMQFPQWILKQTKLFGLDLSDNMLSGKLDALFPMENLTYLNISHNQLTGPIPQFTSSLLSSIDLSYNLLSGPIIHEGPFAKNYDSVGTSVCRLSSLQFLDLQKNIINGSIPDCWGNSSTLRYINLSSNKLSGIIPKSLGRLLSLEFLKLSNNFLRGSIPQTVASCAFLNILDLGENKLSGDIPISWGSAKTKPNLQMLRLRGNQLGGVIPTTLCSLPMLQLIDLAHNSLSGPIPHCFGHLKAMDLRAYPGSCRGLDCVDYPSYGDPLDDSITVVLKGAELQYTTTLKYVVDLDLSCNTLVGSIPDEISSLSGLVGLNLSHNHLTGIIPKKIGEMKSLESLDLSNNYISGTIPSSISDLTFLVGFNLSNNKLHGEIPTGNQLQTLTDPSSYEGNLGLCGDPLPNKCKTGLSHNQPQQEQEEDDDLMKNPLFYLVIISGLATGFWGVVGSLLLKDRFNFPLFKLVGYIADYLYMQALVRVNRFRN